MLSPRRFIHGVFSFPGGKKKETTTNKKTFKLKILQRVIPKEINYIVTFS